MTAQEIEQLRLLGAPADLIEELSARVEPEAEAFKLWAENRKAFEFFLTCETQFRWSSHSAIGGSLMKGFKGSSAEMPTGLDWAAVAAAARWIGITLPNPRLFEQLRICERAFIQAHRDRQKGRRR